MSLKIIKLGIPVEEYNAFLDNGRFRPLVFDTIQDAIELYSLNRIVLFGSDRTGHALKDIVKERFCGFINSEMIHVLENLTLDAILIATSPLHYSTTINSLKNVLSRKSIPILFLFDVSKDVDIQLIFETQPRSGTHYTINNLLKCLDWGYGTVFNEKTQKGELIKSKDRHFGFLPSNKENPYVIKTHFMKPLHYPEYRYIKTIFQISYIFDSYYSWGKMLSGESKDAQYRLTNNSKEWFTLKGFIKLNKRWLEYISDKQFLRYEDYYLNFEKTIKSISAIIGKGDLMGFEKPFKNINRMYWSDNYGKYLDEDVFHHLCDEFYPIISNYWPEKLTALTVK